MNVHSQGAAGAGLGGDAAAALASACGALVAQTHARLRRGSMQMALLPRGAALTEAGQRLREEVEARACGVGDAADGRFARGGGACGVFDASTLEEALAVHPQLRKLLASEWALETQVMAPEACGGMDTFAVVREVVAELLPGEEVAADTPLVEAGLDSLGAVELRNRLSARLGGAAALPETLVRDCPTVRQLEAHLSEINQRRHVGTLGIGYIGAQTKDSTRHKRGRGNDGERKSVPVRERRK